MTVLYIIIVSLPISTGFLTERDDDDGVIQCLLAHLNRVPPRATALYIVSLPISTGFLPERDDAGGQQLHPELHRDGQQPGHRAVQHQRHGAVAHDRD